MLPELIEYASDGEISGRGGAAALERALRVCALASKQQTHPRRGGSAEDVMARPPITSLKRLHASALRSTGALQVSFGLPQLGWYSDERPADRTHPSDSIVESFRPKLRRFEPRDAAEEQADNAWSGEQWNTPVANKWDRLESVRDRLAYHARESGQLGKSSPARNAQLAVRDVAWPAWWAKSR